METETLEEALKKYADNWESIHPELDHENMTPIEVSEIDFKEGAKWMQERMYSEEEVFKLICDFNYDLQIDEVKDIKEWFEQFKK